MTDELAIKKQGEARMAALLTQLQAKIDALNGEVCVGVRGEK